MRWQIKISDAPTYGESVEVAKEVMGHVLLGMFKGDFGRFWHLGSRCYGFRPYDYDGRTKEAKEYEAAERELDKAFDRMAAARVALNEREARK